MEVWQYSSINSTKAVLQVVKIIAGLISRDFNGVLISTVYYPFHGIDDKSTGILIRFATNYANLLKVPSWVNDKLPWLAEVKGLDVSSASIRAAGGAAHPGGGL